MLRLYFCVLVLFLLTRNSKSDPCTTSDGLYEGFIRNVREDTPVNSVIGNLNIIGGPNEVSLKELNDSRSDTEYLTLDTNSRNITLIKQLDTDTKPYRDTLVFLIQCNTTTAPFASITFKVRVLIVDVNDNRPVFQQIHHTVTVPENTRIDSTIYKNAKATDADQEYGGNERVEYTILQGPYSDYFDIPLPLIPDIVLKKNLDYEQVKKITIRIQASDNPALEKALSSTATLTIHIKDVDDLDPIFSSKKYIAMISADTKPGTVVQVQPPIIATDQDTINEPVVYDFLLAESQQQFEINNTTAVVRVRTRLEAKTAVLVLRATQVNNIRRSAFALLTITITGANVNGPQFLRIEYTAKVSECEPIGSTVLTVTAKDKDQGTRLFYAISGSQSVFTIDQSGNIKLAEKVDYESQREYVFNITASDGRHVAYTTIRVVVMDVNDNNPLLETPSEITVNVEREKGRFITRVKAVDKDPGSVLQYELLTYRGLFSIDREGEISVTGAAEDFENYEYKLLVQITDNGIPNRQTVAVVTVRFPKINLPQDQTIMSAGNDLLAIIFGAVAAVLLLIIILLIVYIIRRHAYTKEQLNKARLRKGIDPQGLTYRAGDPSPVPSGLDFNYNGDLEETSDIDAIEGLEGATSIQENPLSDDNINYGFANHPNEGIAESSEIQLDTAVIPYDNDYDFRGSKNSYHNGSLRTFHTPEGSSSGDSNHSDSTGDSNKGLMKPSIRSSLTKGKKLSWERNGRVPAYNSDTYLETEKKGKKSKEKPEITVYF